MSFLTPLFITGLLAVSLPIFFHLIRRTPRGRLPFSSLMFLEPSPPRVTRRSRLDNWVLLLLRALAVCLLAAAFARPFFRETVDTSTNLFGGRRMAILLDTSASMRRGNLWQDALSRAEKILESTNPQDQVSIAAFDRDWKLILTFEEWSALQPAARKETARQRLEQISPGWGETNLGRALVETAEMLDAISTSEDEQSRQRSKELILISDFQSGSRIGDMHSFSWPETVSLTVQQVKISETTNAGLQLISDQSASNIGTQKHTVRLRITNADDSTRDQFRLHWKNEITQNQTPAEHVPPVDLYVPPGTSLVVRVPVPLADFLHSCGQMVLTGDDHDFDNRVFVDRPAPETLIVMYFGRESAGDSQQLRYYLERAFPNSGQRIVKLVAQDYQAPTILSVTNDVDLVIVTKPPPEPHLDALRQYVQHGGTLFYIAQFSDDCSAFGRLLSVDNLAAREADVLDYALLGDIDFSHPLFADFSESRFSDYTKIHFWKHRVLPEESLPSPCRILARFDDGSPAILEAPLGNGTTFLLTSGWNPQESQLALSSKFPPMMNRILELAVGRTNLNPYYTVGDAVPLETAKQADEHRETLSLLTVQLPDHSEILLASGQSNFRNTVVPGIYRVSHSKDVTPANAKGRRFAVNLSADESKTSPMALEQLEAMEIRLTDSEILNSSQAVLATLNRQLRSRELENRQKLWRWLILAVLVVLTAETIFGKLIAKTRSLAENG